MKTTFLSGILLFSFLSSVLAQENPDKSKPDLSNDKVESYFKSIHGSYFVADIGYLNIPIKNLTSHGMILNLGAVFREKYVTGLTFELVTNDRLSVQTTTPVVSPTYSYSFIGWHNEYLIMPEKRLNASLQLQAGLAQASYRDKSETTLVFTGKVLMPVAKLVASDAFFVLAPGADIFLNVSHIVSIGVGGHYRFAFGVDRAGSNADYSNYSLTATLRFKGFP